MLRFLFVAVLSVAVFPLGFSVATVPTSHTYESATIEHSGGTDKNGCHKDRKRGGRHCH